MARRLKRKSKKRDDFIGQIIIVILVVVGVAVVGGLYWVKSTRVQLDRQTFCPVDGPHSLTVVLLDRTDPLTTVQRAALRQRLAEIKDGVPRYGRLEIYSVGPVGEALLSPVVEVCNPGRGSEVDPTIFSPRLVERRWRERFEMPLEAALERLAMTEEAETSPIMESIQSVAVSTFMPLKGEDLPLRLIISSDMLQHSREYSHYQERPDIGRFRGTAYYRQLRADLRGVDVEILYVRRETRKAAQGAAHVQFWRDYIDDLGGRLVHVVALEG